MSQDENVAIIGSGPAGLSAGIYLARANLKPILFTGYEGSQLLTTTVVENYLGMPNVNANSMISIMQKQAEEQGVKLIYEDVNQIDLSSYPYTIKYGFDNLSLTAKAIILCTGSYANRMKDTPGEQKFNQHGISQCATCDGKLISKNVIKQTDIYNQKQTDKIQPTIHVIGAGDVAFQEALYLTSLDVNVNMIIRKDKNGIRASKLMQDRVFSNPKISVMLNSEVIQFKGEKSLQSIVIKNNKTNETTEIPCFGIFEAIGHKPNTSYILGNENIKLDKEGYVILKDQSQKSTQFGIFAAGDVCDKEYRQAITSAGSGARAALDCIKWIQQMESEKDKSQEEKMKEW